MRMGLYRLLGFIFRPVPDRWDEARAAAGTLAQALKGFRHLAFAPAAATLLEKMAKTRRNEGLDRYQELFAQPAPLVLALESAYVGRDPSRQAEVVASAVEQYLRAGVKPDPAAEPDHLAAELEFVAFLCEQEAKGWQARNLTATRKALKREARFLDKHLTRWLPLVDRRLRRYDPGGLYSAAAAAAWALAAHDRDWATLLDRYLAEVGID
jgi:TorA maturation chaperone TorD